MRSGLLIIAIIAAYTLLGGWPQKWHIIVRVCVSVSLLIVIFFFWGQCEKPTSTPARSARKPTISDYSTISITGLLVECFFLIPLSITPEKSEELALAVDEALRSESDYEVKKIAAKLFDSLTRHLNTKVRLSLASEKRLAKLAT